MRGLGSACLCQPNWRTTSSTHPARVALQELDLLIELDVISPQVVQLALQCVHCVLHHAVLLHGEQLAERLSPSGAALIWDAEPHCTNEAGGFTCLRSLTLKVWGVLNGTVAWLHSWFNTAMQ